MELRCNEACEVTSGKARRHVWCDERCMAWGAAADV